MSGRSISRFALAGLLAAAFAAPAAAQEGGGFPVPLNSDPLITLPQALPEAPMPRAKAGAIEFALPFDGLNEKMLQTKTGSFLIGPAIEINVAPMPRAAAQGPCCGADCCRKSATAAPATLPGCTQLLRDETYMLAQTMPQPVPPFASALPCPTQGLTTGGLGAWQPVPCTLPPATLPQRQLFTFGDSTRIQVVVADDLMCPPCPLPQITPNPLLGTWYRDTGMGLVVATYTHDELKLRVTQIGDGATVTFTITAHYTLTKDGLVYGAVTGADVDGKQIDGKSDLGMELAEMSLKLQELTDGPFSFRTKMTSAGLMVSHLKVASTEQIRGSELAILGGVYKSAKDGVVPAPKAIGRTGRTDCQPPLIEVPVQTLPYPPAPAPTMSEPIQRVGIDFNVNPPLVQAPHGTDVYKTSPPKVSITVPPCNDAMKGMAADAFGQLLKQGSGTVMGGMTLPTGRYLEHFPQYFAPDPVFPLPRELASNEDPEGAVRRGAVVAPLKPGHVGTWVRMIGSKQCVVKIEADYLTITVSEAHELGDKMVTGHLTFTADYHTTRDGLTVVGLITSVDVKFDGDLPEDTMLEQFGELQKAMEEKPFAMTFRRYGETLVIGNVRMPEVGDRIDTPPAAYIGGRYTSAGDKPLPKLKAVKATEPKAPPVYFPPVFPGAPGTYGLPPGFYGYGPPPPTPPVVVPPPVVKGELLPPQAVPCPTVPRPVEFVVPAGVGGQRVIVEESLVLPPAIAPTPPTMQMPQPTPPTVSCEEKKVTATDVAVAWRNQIAYKPDPTQNGAKSAGIAGQLFLVGGEKMEFAMADGTLTVDLTDETPRPAGQPAATPERWQIDKNTLRKLRTTDETFGKSYVLFLPWSAYKADITKVKISVRYDPDNGHTLYQKPTVVTFGSENPAPTVPAPQMPQPTAPTVQMPPPVPPAVQVPYSTPLGFGMRVIVPPVSQTPKSNLDNKQIFNFALGVFGSP